MVDLHCAIGFCLTDERRRDRVRTGDLVEPSPSEMEIRATIVHWKAINHNDLDTLEVNPISMRKAEPVRLSVTFAAEAKSPFRQAAHSSGFSRLPATPHC